MAQTIVIDCKCSICLESMQTKDYIVLYKKKYDNISRNERIHRLHRGLSSYPLQKDNYNIYRLKCNHYFHKKCLNKWLKKSVSCPLCRQDLRIQPKN